MRVSRGLRQAEFGTDFSVSALKIDKNHHLIRKQPFAEFFAA